MNLSLALPLALLVLGQDTSVSQPEKSSPAAKALAAFKAEAGQFVLRLDDRRVALLLDKDPVLRWDNPARTGEDGALFVWRDAAGRPQSIGTIFTYRLGGKINRKHEFHSLALAPLSADFGGKTVWSPRTAGVTFQRLDKAPAVAATSRQRLTQMKSMARDFSASMRDLEGEEFQLRLLTQPLLRYEPKDEQGLDGAIFAFSLGTDPEVLLLLEARAAGEAHQWQFALARFHYVELSVTHDDRQVWRAEPLRDFVNLDIGAEQCRDSVYATYHIERSIPAE